MADDGFYIINGCTRKTEKVMCNLKVIDSVDIKAALEHEVDNLGNFACIAVFDRKNGAVAFAADNRFVSGSEIPERNLFCGREDVLCGNVRKSALNSAVCNPKTFLEHLLIFSGNSHCFFKKIYVIGTENFVRDKLGVPCDNFVFAALVKNRKTTLLFIFGNKLCGFHSSDKKRRHFLIYFIDAFSCFFKFVHKEYSSASFLKEGMERSICSVETQ